MARNLAAPAMCLALFGSMAGFLAQNQGHQPTVTTENGVLRGMHFGRDPNGSAFLGVPYAAAPIGERRWRPPQPMTDWKGTREATQFGAACPQLPAPWLPFVGWNEDCLFLNVWTPNLSPVAKLPVLVYFHGGSNAQGYSQMTPLGPAFSKLGLVVVSANYRLGPFGFLAHPALSAESSHHSSGNYGLLDQIAALRWLKANVAHFGGDSTQITILGQSAGAVDACLLMSSPLAAELFARAILQSGECQSFLNMDLRLPIAYNFISGTGEGNGEHFTRSLGIGDRTHLLESLRRLPPEKILEVWNAHRDIRLDAIVDGWVVPQQPAMTFAQGKQAKVPVLVGSNADEATVFAHTDITTLEQYKAHLLNDTGKFWWQQFQLYPAKTDAEVAAQTLRLETDSFAYGAFSMAEAVMRSGGRAYLYYFTFRELGKRARLGAYHGEELKFLSNSFPPDWQHTPDDEKLAQAMRAYWAQFAKTGDPNGEHLPEWPGFDERLKQWFELGRQIVSNPVPVRIEAYHRLMQTVIADEPELAAR